MWRLTGNAATWQCGQFHATADLAHPEQGLVGLVLSGQSLSTTSLLQVRLTGFHERATLRLVDGHVRGSDLIAAYTDAEKSVRPEVYWRVFPGQGQQTGSIMVEAVLSVQTDLLSSDPSVAVVCRLPAERCHVMEESGAAVTRVRSFSEVSEPIAVAGGIAVCGLVFPLVESAMAVGLVFDTADTVQATLLGDARRVAMTASVTCFRGCVEKGVIRRTRLRAVLAAADQMTQVLSAHWTDMLAAPPPLAT